METFKQKLTRTMIEGMKNERTDIDLMLKRSEENTQELNKLIERDFNSQRGGIRKTPLK